MFSGEPKATAVAFGSPLNIFVVRREFAGTIGVIRTPLAGPIR
jgi:hypothetical protein